MKKSFICLFLGLFLAGISNSCEFLRVCEDDKLSTTRLPYNANDLKINGFYYGDTVISQNKPIIYVNYFFRNGIVIFNSMSLDNIALPTPILFADSTLLKQSKSSWGLFKIEGNKLIIEQWIPQYGGCLKAVKEETQILNDTTYLRKRTNTLYHFKASYFKPDSTNNFIK